MERGDAEGFVDGAQGKACVGEVLGSPQFVVAVAGGGDVFEKEPCFESVARESGGAGQGLGVVAAGDAGKLFRIRAGFIAQGFVCRKKGRQKAS